MHFKWPSESHHIVPIAISELYLSHSKFS